VVDCWYDSGAMPFAQWGYPHAPGSKEQFAQAFPADFISEAIDQTRGWFYSLLAESTLLSDPEAQTETTKQFVARGNPQPYKVCVVLGHVCDEKGEKMAKSKGNYLDPTDILKEEGADALRWFFYSCNNPWTNSRFSRTAVREAQKEFLIKLWNVYSFFTIYANLDGFTPATCGKLDSCLVTSKRGAWTPLRGGLRGVSERCELDRWIMAELYRTVAEVRRRLDDYDIYDAAGALDAFAESLSNWFVRRSRERFWRSWKTPDRSAPEDLDKQEAYWTLYECLTTFAQAMAPFVPFMAEEIWQNLVRKPLGGRVPESVHLCAFPEADPKAADAELAAEMDLVRDMSSLGRAARAAARIKTRQPLSRAIVIMAAGEARGVIEKHEHVIRDELNVKKLESDVDASRYVTQSYELNFKLIGQRFRDKVPQLKEAVSKMAPAVTSVGAPQESLLVRLADGTGVTLAPEDYRTLLKAKEGFAAASGRHGVVILDTHLTEELREEGYARELVKLVNGFRGELKLRYEQRIKLAVKGGERMERTARKFEEYIRGETLAVELRTGEVPAGWKTCEAKVEGEQGTIALIEA
jgi:isoleucyl-tRNA synthetase